MHVRVVSARESAALDADAIDSGIPSRALMRVASANAAAVIAQRCGDRLRHGVTVYTGPGNNGGDGWCVARALARTGVPVAVVDVVPSATADAQAERDAAADAVMWGERGQGRVVIDALLGTGSSGAPRAAVADAVRQINSRRERGDYVIALDVPTGLDATTGACEGSVCADLTITFGACKHGLLISRAACGEIVVVDIGLAGAAGGLYPLLADALWVNARIPAIPADAHKGTRKKLTIVGGNVGMGGAVVLAAMAALRSGIGLVRVVTHERNLTPLQARVPEALTTAFPTSDAEYDDIVSSTDTLLVGPGIGRGGESRRMVEALVTRARVPVVLDADALTVFAGEVERLGAMLHRTPAVVTPHPAEFARLIGTSDVTTVLAQRFDAVTDVARALHAAVLLKGTPSIITAPNGVRVVSAAGTPALATGGSGDLLSGIVATLLAHGCAPHVAAAAGAWLHGRAAELCGPARGTTLDDVLACLPAAWQTADARVAYPVLAELPRVA
jgi:NAD(P)H-hydrate epimerase